MNTKRMFWLCIAAAAVVASPAADARHIWLKTDNDELRFGADDDFHFLFDTTALRLKDTGENVMWSVFDLGTTAQLRIAGTGQLGFGDTPSYVWAYNGTNQTLTDGTNTLMYFGDLGSYGRLAIPTLGDVCMGGSLDYQWRNDGTNLQWRDASGNELMSLNDAGTMGALTVSGSLTASYGPIYSGDDDSGAFGGHVIMYGANGSCGPELRLHNASDNDSIVDYWMLTPVGGLLLRQDAAGDIFLSCNEDDTMSIGVASKLTTCLGNFNANGAVSVLGAYVDVGTQGTTRGLFRAYGAATADGGGVQIYNDDASDGETDSWMVWGDAGDLTFTGAGGTSALGDVMYISASDGSIAMNTGSLAIGIAGSKYGLLDLKGDAADNGGVLRLEGPDDADMIIDHWDIRPDATASNELRFEANGGSADIGILANLNYTVLGDGVWFELGQDDLVAGTADLYGNETELGGSLRLYNGGNDDGSVGLWNFSANADGNGGLGLRVDGAYLCWWFTVTGEQHCGIAGSIAGNLYCEKGTTAGYLVAESDNETPTYLFASDDGKWKYHTAAPTSDGDGYYVGSILDNAYYREAEIATLKGPASTNTNPLTMDCAIAYTPAVAETVSEGATIDPAGNRIQYLTAAGNVTTSAAEAVDEGYSDGHEIVFINQSANTICVKNGARTAIGGDITLGQYDSLTLVYDAGNAIWVRTAYQNN